MGPGRAQGAGDGCGFSTEDVDKSVEAFGGTARKWLSSAVHRMVPVIWAFKLHNGKTSTWKVLLGLKYVNRMNGIDIRAVFGAAGFQWMISREGAF
jgi:hypothetical protein